ncbi:MAG: hypothetical protein ACI9G5_001787 [Paracoccaceae bacterium]|jgi:hypothetical protein
MGPCWTSESFPHFYAVEAGFAQCLCEGAQRIADSNRADQKALVGYILAK